VRILFFAFPTGPPAVGLLLLRLLFATRFIAEGVDRLTAVAGVEGVAGGGIGTGVGLFVVLCAVLLGVGFLTPFAQGLLAVVDVVASADPALAVPARIALPGLFPAFEACVLMCMAVIGPGAYSLDARLFGREEIIIPPRIPLRTE